jgi:hypothetical protein
VALSMRAKEVEVRPKRGGERLEPDEALRAAAGFWVDVLPAQTSSRPRSGSTSATRTSARTSTGRSKRSSDTSGWKSPDSRSGAVRRGSRAETPSGWGGRQSASCSRSPGSSWIPCAGTATVWTWSGQNGRTASVRALTRGPKAGHLDEQPFP